VLYTLGDHHLRLQRTAQAEDTFQRMLTTTPEDNQELQGLAFYGLARVALLKQRMTEARQLGEESVSILKSIRHHHTKTVEQWLEIVPE